MFRSILREGGAKCLYQGCTSTLIRKIVGIFIFFYGYEFGRSLLTQEGKTKDEIGKLKLLEVVCTGFNLKSTDRLSFKIHLRQF